MSYRLIKIVATAAAIAATPAWAQAQTVAYGSSSPVDVVGVTLATENIAWTGAGVYPARAGAFAANTDPGSITLRFVNRSAVPATSVTFDVNDGGENRRIVDKGTFRPGALIEHTFIGHAASSNPSLAAYAVAQVDFADGTAWHAAGTDVADDSGAHGTADDADAAADTMERQRAELEERNAASRRLAFRHLGTSL